MAYTNVKRNISNEALYWIGKVYYHIATFGFYVQLIQTVGRTVIQPPRTDDFREIETFNRLVSGRVTDVTTFLSQTAITPVKNVTTSWTYWIDRRTPWQLGL